MSRAVDASDLAVSVAERVAAAVATGRSTAFVLTERPDVARALRKLAKRAQPRWSDADGYVISPDAAGALVGKGPSDTAYSPTALQFFAACPYRFYLYGIARFRGAEAPDAFAVDALTRGSLLHDIYFRAGVALRGAALLPLSYERRAEAGTLTAEIVDACIVQMRAKCLHVHEVVWDDAMAEIRTDAMEWLDALLGRPEVPAFFELAFGLEATGDARDAASVEDSVLLACGLRVRGSVDLIERLPDGRLRATDYKTGKVASEPGDVIQGGELLQPVIYALVLEQVLKGESVAGGQLWYGTFRGEYTHVDVPLNEEARASAQALHDALAQAVARGAFPKSPSEGACTYCEYRGFCDEAHAPRVSDKPAATLPALTALRARR